MYEGRARRVVSVRRCPFVEGVMISLSFRCQCCDFTIPSPLELTLFAQDPVVQGPGLSQQLRSRQRRAKPMGMARRYR